MLNGGTCLLLQDMNHTSKFSHGNNGTRGAPSIYPGGGGMMTPGGLPYHAAPPTAHTAYPPQNKVEHQHPYPHHNHQHQHQHQPSSSSSSSSSYPNWNGQPY
jgi:hypothetical protein